MRILLCLMLVACEKAGGVEATVGTSSHDEAPAKPTAPRAVATLPNDAGVVVVAAPEIVPPKPAPKLPKPPTPPRRDDVAMSEESARAFADLLTSEGPNDKSEGDMARRSPNSDLDKQYNGGAEVRVGGGGRGTRGDGDPRVGTRDDKVGTGRGPSIDKATPPADQPKGPSGRVSVATKQAFDNSTLTPDMVLAKIQSVYMAGIKRCYKNYLAKDPVARGKLALSLTVTESGMSVNAKASGFASEIDDCVTGQMGGWRFPSPKDADDEKTQASFAIGLQLVPD